MKAPVQAAPTDKVPLYEKLSFGIGELGNNLFWQFFMIYLLYFYTDIYKIAPGKSAGEVTALMFGTVRFFDALFDVFMGVVADRTNSRWGKYRPYLLFGALPFGLAGVLAFTTPSFDAVGKIVYAYITYTFLMMMYSLVAIPQNSLLGVLSPNTQERTVLSTFKFVFAFSAGLIVQACTPFLVKLYGHGNEARGYQMTLVSYAVLAVAFFVLCFFAVRERVSPPAHQKTNLKRDFSDLLTNLPWIVLSVTTLATIMAIAIRIATVIYYFKYYVKDQTVNTVLFGTHTFTHDQMFSTFMVMGTVVTLLGTMAVPYFTRLIGKKALYCVLVAGSGVVTAAFYFIPPEKVGLIFLLQILYSLTMGPTSAVLWAMYADCADYSEWKHDRRATGLVFSAAIMAQKFGWTFGGIVPGVILTYFGYVADTNLSAHTLNGILLMNSIIPAVCAFAAAGLVLMYSLTDTRVKAIELELKARRAAAA